MSKDNNFEDAFKAFEQKYKNDINYLGKVLGRGRFGEVRDIKYKNRPMAIKIMEREKDEDIEGEKLALNLRNYNVVRIQKIYEGENLVFPRKKNKEQKRANYSSKNTYDFIIMEKAVLRDLGKLSEFYHRHNLLKLIKQDNVECYIFDENAGDNLIRFYSRQIINALATLDNNNYVHFDIKPENLLVSLSLIIKLTDFSLLKEVKENYIDFGIPGGTPGYLTREYYINRRVTPEVARKQDYFALGSSLFLFKYGLQLLKYKKFDDTEMNADRIVDLLEHNINYLKKQVFTDKDFMIFIQSLISYKPDGRANFQQIIRNRWLNKSIDELDKIVMSFENDEEKLIIELQKNDYLMKREEHLKEKNNNFSRTNKYRFKKKQE
jgi:serine/threonine protein kinase